MDLRSQKIEVVAEELVKEGLLTADQLAVAKESQKNIGGDLGNILIDRGFASEKEFFKKLGKQAGFTVISLSSYTPDPNALQLLSEEQAKKWRLIPLFEVEGKITVATDDPFNFTLLDEARIDLGFELDCVLAPSSEIKQLLQRFYGATKKSSPESKRTIEVIRYEEERVLERGSPVEQIEREAQAGRVVQAVNQILLHATREMASDIHLEPMRDGLKVRLRVDGVLMDLPSQPKVIQQAIISRFKILGGMDVAERRVPQDGRVRLKIDEKDLDLRMATYPTIFGEAAAIRLLSKDQLRTLDDLGFGGKDKETFAEMIQKPHGMLLVTGPTGSGKSTTLYATLLSIDRKKNHVLSVEEPVEHEIEGVSQTQINVKAGVTFGTTLRSMLRQDPDIIMVGEIRDKETAEISLRAAMTGHLVFSTLHTNSAVGSVARLIDLGVEPFLIASNLIGMMAQRLVRKICPRCKVEAKVTPQEIDLLGPKANDFKAFKGKGCKECRMVGFKGRTAIFELVRVDDEMRVLISNRMPEVRLKEKAFALGARSLLEDGIEKIRAGITTVEEVLRVAAQI